MESILSDIKAVPGVTGVMVLAKDTLESYHLLPASFTSRSIRDVGERLSRLAQRLPPHSRLNLKFENGLGLVYNLNKSVVLIFGRQDVDFSLLGLVLKSALQSIERRVESLKDRKEEVVKTESFVVDKDSLNLLIEAINMVAQGYVKDKGIFWVTKNLRRAKENVIKEFPLVSGFYVDNHGRVSVLKPPREMFDRKTPLALAKWIDLFVNHAPHPPPRGRLTDIKALTARISDPLEGIGFYDLYNKVARKLV
jgi:predicted regulator of Ras-like GTPase activity (Roadblock/LC7/MglB family)